MILGVLGVGHLAGAMLAGFLRSGIDPGTILLSPRGKATALAARRGLRLASGNRDLVERSDVVILAVRPADASRAVAGPPWREGQVVISVCAGVPLSRLDVGPAHAVRAMPFTASEIGASPTVFFPEIDAARALLERLGPAIALSNEKDFEVATVSAALYGWAQDLIRQAAEWSASRGLEPGTARRLTALTFVAAGRLIAEKPEPMDRMLVELVTPGGITERGLEVLAAHGVPAAWQEACAAVLERLTGEVEP